MSIKSVFDEYKPASKRNQQSYVPFGQSEFNLPTSNYVDAASVWTKMKSSAGPKSSGVYVAAMEQALSSAGLSEDDYILLVRRFKTVPFGPEEKIKSQLALNAAAGMKKVTVGFNESKPVMATEAGNERLIQIILAIRRSAGPLADKMSWGAFSQCKIVIDIISNVKLEFIMLSPDLKELLHKKIVYNILNFNDGLLVMVNRWKCIMRSIGLLQVTPGVIVTVQGNTQVPGDPKRRIISPHFDIDRTKAQSAKVNFERSGADRANIMSVLETAADLGDLMSGMVAVDFRMLLQAPDLRQARTQNGAGSVSKMYQEVSDQMASVIKTTPGGPGKLAAITVFDLGSESGYTQLYYECLSFWKATVRSLNATAYGKGGDANTRKNMVVLAKPTDAVWTK